MIGIAAFLRMYRTRLWMAAAFSLVVVLIDIYLAVAHCGGWRMFWRGECNYPPRAFECRTLMVGCAVICFYVGAGLGIPSGRGMFAGNGSITQGDTRFLLTRPISRLGLLLQPLAIALCALLVLPFASILLLLGWFWMVKAPALDHIRALLQLVPAAARLGPDASLWSVAAAAHFWQYYAAAWSLGFCSYALMSSQRWLGLSQNWQLKIAGGLMLPALFYAPIYLVRSSFFRHVVLLVPAQGSSLDVAPSLLGISSHVIFALLVMYGCWRLARIVEA